MSDHAEPIHDWFELSYSSYLVIPRLALQEMPVDWQRRLVALLDEAEAGGMATPSDYTVQRRINGRFRRDPWADYRRSSVEAARAQDKRLETPVTTFGTNPTAGLSPHTRILHALAPLSATAATTRPRGTGESEGQ